MAAKSASDSGLKQGEEMEEFGNKMEKMELGEKKSLPHELIVDILSRLPANYLWPLRCVCKTWFGSITRDPQFAKSIFDRSIHLKSNFSIIARLEDENNDFYLATDHTECDKAIVLKDLPFFSHQDDTLRCPVYGICNGMLCISHFDKEEVYIWNPLTNDHITIPCPPTPLQSSHNRLNTIFGFGFLPSANEYKVIKLVGVCNWGKLYHTHLSIYTLGIDLSWRTVGEDVPYDISFKGVSCPQINGLLYWLARMDGELSVRTILAFDLKDEFLYEIDNPPINFKCDMTCLQELAGSLCLFNARNEKDVDIWTMKPNGESYSWTKQFTIGRPEVIGNFSLLIPLGVVAHNGDIIFVKNEMGLITYNSNTNSISHLKEFNFPICNAHAYFGSIISPRVIGGARHIMA